MNLSEHARGKWPEIINAIIGPEYTSKTHGKCPSTGEGCDRYRFSDHYGTGNFFCDCSDGKNDGFVLIQCVKGWNFPQAARAIEDVIGAPPGQGKPERKPATWANKLRNETVKSERSAYLESRGLEVPPTLEWHHRLPYFKDNNKAGEFPAMLAPITKDGRFLTYHVTYLSGMNKIRKILPANNSLRGGAIELYPAGEILGVAEGIETAIAAHMLSGLPVWSVVNTALMGQFKPPQGVKHVYIFADNDKNFAGQAAAYKLAHSLSGKVGVEVMMPQIPGTDYNDLLKESTG